MWPSFDSNLDSNAAMACQQRHAVLWVRLCTFGEGPASVTNCVRAGLDALDPALRSRCGDGGPHSLRCQGHVDVPDAQV
jgi:hypothetical protein